MWLPNQGGFKRLLQWLRETRWVDKALEPVTMLTVAIVIVSLLQWNVMARTDATMREQVRVMQDQTDAMRSQIAEMRTEQRPWIFADIAILDDLTFNKDSIVQLSLRFTLQNVGHLPALHTFPFIEIASADGFKLTPERCAKLRHLYSDAGRYVFPGQSQAIDVGLNTPFEPLPGQHDGYLMLDGCIQYDSPSDQTKHYTTFSLAVLQNVAGKITRMFDPSQERVGKDTLKLITVSQSLLAD